MDLLPSKNKGLVPAGRLDEDSEGLLLITNDGDLIHGLTHPSFRIEKKYEVILPRIPGKELKKLEKGIRIGNDYLKASKISFPGGKKIIITLREGKNREIRRMLGMLGYRAEKLKRISIGCISIANLKPGKYRELTPKEVIQLKGLINGNN